MSHLELKLTAINGLINRWRAFERLLPTLAGLLAIWFALTATDVWWRPRLYGRVALSAILAISAVAALVWLMGVLTRKRSPAAVAALLEKHFPQLDNHLINRVLFAADTTSSSSSWLKTYLNEGTPGFESLPLEEIKNRNMRKRGAIAAGLALLALIAPAFVLGDAWTIAMRRVANPFSSLAPPTFAKVIAVEPANRTIVQGDGVTLAVRAVGRAGQFVDIDLYPADDKRATLRIGQFAATGEETTFEYRVAKVSTSVGYRFKVGDAYPTERYTVDTVPPLAIEAMDVRVTPPAYTSLGARTFDGLTNAITIPVHAEVAFRIVCNRPVVNSVLTLEQQEVALAPAADRRTWTGSVTVAQGSLFQVQARDEYGLDMRVPFRFQLVEDRSPDIRLVAPAASRAVLPPNAAPVVQFQVSDEYGLGVVRIERVRRGARPGAEGELLKEWNLDGQRQFNDLWTGTIEDVDLASALRIVAFDNANVGEPNRIVSPLIVFEMTNMTSKLAIENQQRAEARQTIGDLISRQRATLQATSRLQTTLPVFDEPPWRDVADRQTDIRAYAAALLRMRDAAVGPARVALERALQGPLPDAAASLARVVTGAADLRGQNAEQAIAAQHNVLRLLAQIDDNMGKGEVSQAAAGLLAMLEAIRKGQTDNLAATLRNAQANNELPVAIVDRQDNLAHDMEAMIGFCRAEAKQMGDDEEFARIMSQIADRATNLRLHPIMIDVAEIMDSERFADSVPPQHTVTNGIAQLSDLLRAWREAETREKTADALAIIRDARQSIQKLEDLQSQIVDALRDTGSQGDKTEKIDDDLLEEILDLKGNMANAMLKVATDLQALPELEAVNELVTDVFQTYEEMKQVAGSGTNAVSEIGLQKEDWVLETLAKTGQKADEMEMWLKPTPDNKQLNTEQFDKDEMLAPIGQVTMPEELQDIVGDLLEQEEELARQADDSVTNHGDANVDAGWDIAEGEFVDYNASGKSGNDRPDHKDQDGRSQVGRQGMSSGEVMARSGMINEGDQNIDRRRTQDSNQSGDVEEEGHTAAVATGGGKNSGYSHEKGMEGGDDATRRDTKVSGESQEATRAQLTRNAESVYAQAQISNLRTFDLRRYIAFSKQMETLLKQNASPAMIAELHRKAIQALATTHTSLETGISARSMGAGGEAETAAEGVAASPDDAPAEFRDMVADYFKAIGELN